MSTITKEFTKEQLIEKLQRRSAIAEKYPDVEEAQFDAAIFKIALASLEAEPVAVRARWKDEVSGHGNWKYYDIAHRYSLMADESRDCELIYTAPPAPVAVPDDVSGPLAHAYKELTPTFMRNHIGVFERYGIYPDGSAGIQAMRIALDGMSRRAAMLQGAGGNSPVIPDGWVACSERMPVENDIVLVVDDGYFVCEAQYRDGDFYSAARGNGEFFETTCRDVELWMPLPTAPQQEVKP